MQKSRRIVRLRDLVEVAYAEAERRVRDPLTASVLAAWAVERVLQSHRNRPVARALARMAQELAAGPDAMRSRDCVYA